MVKGVICEMNQTSTKIKSIVEIFAKLILTSLTFVGSGHVWSVMYFGKSYNYSLNK